MTEVLGRIEDHDQMAVTQGGSRSSSTMARFVCIPQSRPMSCVIENNLRINGEDDSSFSLNELVLEIFYARRCVGPVKT